MDSDQKLLLFLSLADDFSEAVKQSDERAERFAAENADRADFRVYVAAWFERQEIPVLEDRLRELKQVASDAADSRSPDSEQWPPRRINGHVGWLEAKMCHFAAVNFSNAGDAKKARTFNERGVHALHDPLDADDMLMLARFHEDLGNRERAIGIYQTVADNEVGDTQLEALRRIHALRNAPEPEEPRAGFRPGTRWLPAACRLDCGFSAVVEVLAALNAPFSRASVRRSGGRQVRGRLAEVLWKPTEMAKALNAHGLSAAAFPRQALPAGLKDAAQALISVSTSSASKTINERIRVSVIPAHAEAYLCSGGSALLLGQHEFQAVRTAAVSEVLQASDWIVIVNGVKQDRTVSTTWPLEHVKKRAIREWP